MITQEQFDRFVEDYNEDYRLLLKRASLRHYDCLISSFLVLKDLYNVIMVLFDSGTYTLNILPYPFSFRANEVLLGQLGFNEGEIKNIFDFLDFVSVSQGMEFEDCMEAGTVAMCARIT